MVEENVMEEKCPHCGETITVIGCRTCEYIELNLTDYQNSPCVDCNMFHRNYNKKVDKNE